MNMSADAGWGDSRLRGNDGVGVGHDVEEGVGMTGRGAGSLERNTHSAMED